MAVVRRGALARERTYTAGVDSERPPSSPPVLVRILTGELSRCPTCVGIDDDTATWLNTVATSMPGLN